MTESEAEERNEIFAHHRRMKELINRGWCQGANALNDKNRDTIPISPRAVKWCMLGAAARASYDIAGGYGPKEDRIMTAFLNAVLVDMADWSLPVKADNGAGAVDFNDAPGRTKEEVLAFIDNITLATIKSHQE